MIEIYGIVSESHKCPACDFIVKRLEEDGIEYSIKNCFAGC
ncbi:anaerobic nucleotide reductase subunit [Aeromonas phage phiAS4]|uniref:Anaerobic nucleotide reductase subunit n=1 Tax=Aeromonas phage phiAS4 TaxID=879628 RepID=E1A1S0_9CAUD|nr:anaerobic nucleotide reductase subunit [Aeromonas phage phiAS4]ADM79794.1 anaerobic nucleotide reductase subunit [Aeromonas phage phiAS4]